MHKPALPLAAYSDGTEAGILMLRQFPAVPTAQGHLYVDPGL